LLHRNRLLSQRQLAAAKCLVALTEGDAAEWRKVVKHVEVIPNMVTLNNSCHYSDLTNRQVIFVGRMDQQKGLPELLAVWQRVYARHPDWSLHVFGVGPLRQWFVCEAERLQIGIVMHEPVLDIMEKYRESSLLMLTSVYEPFGLVLVEAMSCGVPAVAFDCPYGPACIVSDGGDGYLVAPDDVETFANRVCQLIEDKELRQRMGRQAVSSSQRFTQEAIMPMWKNLFEKLTRK
jgi:glycosyltransferase involved in cell wall biosynthesis